MGDEWEYLEFMYNWDKKTMLVETNLPVELFSNKIAGCVVAVNYARQGSIKIQPLEALGFIVLKNNVLNFLGIQGWEGYAVVWDGSDYTYCLKRKK